MKKYLRLIALKAEIHFKIGCKIIEITIMPYVKMKNYLHEMILEPKLFLDKRVKINLYHTSPKIESFLCNYI